MMSQEMYASSFPEDARPPIVSFSPSLWTDTFSSFTFDHLQVQESAAEIKTLKEEVRTLLMADQKNTSEKLVLIDTIERLGVAYHFDEWIDEQLEQVYKSYLENDVDERHDLFGAALQFRLLRQHRYNVSCDGFDKFKDKNNKFKETVSRDARGLLSLYEAANVRIHGEIILEEAVNYTTQELNHMLPELEGPLRNQVNQALHQALHRGVPRIEARNYIFIYEMYDTHNELLLKLAKLDFNYLQSLYRKELHDLMRWWKDIGIMSKLPYARDRLVECYLWGVACRFEPQYSYFRIMVAKSMQMVTIMDDSYDNYATLAEAELFTKILERWDITEISPLPDYMKIVYKFILSIYEDYEIEAAEQHKSFAIPYAKEAVKQLGRAYCKELKWFMGRQMPTFEDYFDNTVITSCIHVMFSAVIPGMKSVSNETIDWLKNKANKMVISTAKMGRYVEDLGSHERENREGQMFTAVDCYMNQYGVTKEEALEKFVNGVEDGWKDVNMEWLVKNDVPYDFFEGLLNYARIAEVTYKNCYDGYTNPEKFLAPQIVALFVDPIM